MESINEFRERGYIICADLFDEAEVDFMRTEALRCVDANRETLGLPTEDEIGDPQDLLDRILCVHHVHKLSERYVEIAADRRITDVLKSLIGPDVKCLQSQLFIKPPGFPGNPWHQDEGPIPTRDRSLVAVWIALDDATTENGCLRVVPASHRDGFIYPTRHHHMPGEYDFTTESYGFEVENAKDVELRAGSAVFFHGYLVHGSECNRSETLRRALTLHYMNSFSLLPWQGGQGDYRDVFPVLGPDPYEWKGYEERSIPHLRLWPQPARSPEEAGLDIETRRSISAAIHAWSSDERRAVGMFRAALGVDGT